MRRGDHGEQSWNYSNVYEPPQISLIQKVFNEEHSSENTQSACLLGVLTAGGRKRDRMLDRQISLPQTFKLLSSDIGLYELVNWGSEIQGSSRSFVSFHEFKRVVDKTLTGPEVENSPGRAKPCPALGGYPGNVVYTLCLWSIWIVIASYRFQHSLVAHFLRVPVCLNTLTALMKQTGLNISLSLNCINSQAYLRQSSLKLCRDPFLCLQLALLPTTQASDIHLHIWY